MIKESWCNMNEFSKNSLSKIYKDGIIPEDIQDEILLNNYYKKTII